MNKLIIAAIIMIAAFTRLLPHPPNFTPIIAMGLFGGAYLKDHRLALIIPISAMLCADIFLGFHKMMVWTYGAIIIISLIGMLLEGRTSLKNGGIAILSSSLLFFLVTNFGVWITSGFYPHTIEGLLICYTAAVPFFGNTLAGSIFYSALIFMGYEQIKKYFPIVIPDTIQK